MPLNLFVADMKMVVKERNLSITVIPAGFPDPPKPLGSGPPSLWIRVDSEDNCLCATLTVNGIDGRQIQTDITTARWQAAFFSQDEMTYFSVEFIAQEGSKVVTDEVVLSQSRNEVVFKAPMVPFSTPHDASNLRLPKRESAMFPHN